MTTTSEDIEWEKDEVYPQRHPIETPELLARKQKEFDDAVAKIPQENKLQLLEAEKQCPEQLTDAFKLLFLRSEVFNIDLAVKRYLKYWEARVFLFEDKAFQPLTREGAFSEDSVAISIGYCNALTTTGHRGRGIVFMNPSKQDKTKYSKKSMCRACWYVLHKLLEREETQKYGVICLAFGQNYKLHQFDRKLQKMNLKALKGGIPIRIASSHICHPPFFASILKPFAELMMGRELMERLLLHSGSKVEVVKMLEDKYGLKKEDLPVELRPSN